MKRKLFGDEFQMIVPFEIVDCKVAAKFKNQKVLQVGDSNHQPHYTECGDNTKEYSCLI
jgi:hypothetical protein